MPTPEKWFGDEEPGADKYALVTFTTLSDGTLVALLEDIYVRKDLEGQGFAWGLLKEIHAYCKSKGIHSLYASPLAAKKDANRRKLVPDNDKERQKRLLDAYKRWGFSQRGPHQEPVGFTYVKELV